VLLTSRPRCCKRIAKAVPARVQVVRPLGQDMWTGTASALMLFRVPRPSSKLCEPRSGAWSALSPCQHLPSLRASAGPSVFPRLPPPPLQLWFSTRAVCTKSSPRRQPASAPWPVVRSRWVLPCASPSDSCAQGPPARSFGAGPPPARLSKATFTCTGSRLSVLPQQASSSSNQPACRKRCGPSRRH
jgi:hypothetical protein